jgi:hypothetical protein
MKEITPEGIVNAGLRERNRMNRTLMLNAARTDNYKLDPELLNWTSLLGVSEAPTQPEIEDPPSSNSSASHPTTIVATDDIIGWNKG